MVTCPGEAGLLETTSADPSVYWWGSWGPASAGAHPDHTKCQDQSRSTAPDAPWGLALPYSGSEYLARLPKLLTLYLYLCGHCLLRPGLWGPGDKKPIKKGWGALFNLYQQLPAGLRNPIQPPTSRNPAEGSLSKKGHLFPSLRGERGLLWTPRLRGPSAWKSSLLSLSSLLAPAEMGRILCLVKVGSLG